MCSWLRSEVSSSLPRLKTVLILEVFPGTRPWPFMNTGMFSNTIIFASVFQNCFISCPDRTDLPLPIICLYPIGFGKAMLFFRKPWSASRAGAGCLYFLPDLKHSGCREKNYSWMKIRNGSYRDFTPNHYPLGYMLVAYGREKYGNDFWAKTAVEAAAFKGLFYPLQKAIKRNAGIPFDSFHTRALDFFQKQLPENAYTSSLALYGKENASFCCR